MALVVMGPAGCGKTTLGAALADALQWQFIEGDTLHPEANIARMRRGEPLTDADRAPWLERIGAGLAKCSTGGVVASCSALKRTYRDALRAAAGPILFVLPVLPRALLEPRLAQRQGHYMPASLLDSQLAILELPTADEWALSVDGRLPLEDQVRQVLAILAPQEG